MIEFKMDFTFVTLNRPLSHHYVVLCLIELCKSCPRLRPALALIKSVKDNGLFRVSCGIFPEMIALVICISLTVG